MAEPNGLVGRAQEEVTKRVMECIAQEMKGRKALLHVVSGFLETIGLKSLTAERAADHIDRRGLLRARGVEFRSVMDGGKWTLGAYPASPEKASRRKSTGKRQRFEIFKRDGFRCIYCGTPATGAPLHVDHVVPLAEGGSGEAFNLVTACSDCNLGKSSVPLAKKHLHSGPTTEADRDHAEQIMEYLKVQREVAAAKQQIIDEVVAYWLTRCGQVPEDFAARVPGLIQWWDVSDLFRAIDIVAGKSGLNHPYYGPTNKLKYLHGILRRWREERER